MSADMPIFSVKLLHQEWMKTLLASPPRLLAPKVGRSQVVWVSGSLHVCEVTFLPSQDGDMSAATQQAALRY